MSVVYKVRLNGVFVNIFSDYDQSLSKVAAMNEYHRLNEKYPDRLVEVIRVKSEVIAKSK